MIKDIYIKVVGFKNKIKRKIYPYLPSSVSYQQSPKKNIIIFSSRRGGSTILSELISHNPGFRYIDQPCDMTDLGIKRHIIEKHIKKPFLSQFIEVNSEEETNLKTYYQNLLSGKIPEMAKISNWPASRTLLKICNALSLVDWFKNNFDVKIVVLVRHPVPQALSVIKNKWEITSEAYFENISFRKKYLTEDQYQFCRKINKEGSELEKGILNWVMENMAPLTNDKREIVFITYEELILNSSKSIDLLTKNLDLENKEGMRNILQKPSSSKLFSDSTTNNAILNNQKEFLINKWESKLSKSEKEAVQKILDIFKISIYNAWSSMPLENYLNFQKEENR